jgi:hypothetical protein
MDRTGGKGVVVGNYLVVGGGETAQGAYSRDLLLYDMAANAWSVVSLDIGQNGGVYDIASAGSGVAVAGLASGNNGWVPQFLTVDIPSGSVQAAPKLPANEKVNWIGVAWTGDQLVALALGDGPTRVGLWRPGASEWSDTSDVSADRLRPRAGTHWDEAGVIEWSHGWLVSIGSTGVFIAAPESGETGIPEGLRTTARRICTGQAAVAFGTDSVFVWGGQNCAGESTDAGGPLSTGTQVTFRPSAGR